jgi:hypothetical protein
VRGPGGGRRCVGVGDSGKIAYLVFLFTASSQLISLLPPSFLPPAPCCHRLHGHPIWAGDLSISCSFRVILEMHGSLYAFCLVDIMVENMKKPLE